MAEHLKIGELAARAGVNKSTVQHYLREGLLPPPVARPHKNVAYYSADLVGRTRLIRELQSSHGLSLSRIRTLLSDDAGTAEVRAYLRSQPPGPAQLSSEPLARDALVADAGVSEAHLDALESLGFVGPDTSGAAPVYSPADVAVVRAVGWMQRAGLNEANGFTLEDMVFYLDAMRDLVAQELALFGRRMGSMPAERIQAVARAGLEGSNVLLLAIRRKVFSQLLGED